MIEVTVENIEKTLKELVKFDVELEDELNVIVKKYAKEITKKAKSLAPVGKGNSKKGYSGGNLKASIKTKTFKKQGPAATVFPRGGKGAHRHLVEYGTKERVQKKTGRKTGRMPARPFMKPAHEAYESQYFTEIKKVIEKDVSI